MKLGSINTRTGRLQTAALVSIPSILLTFIPGSAAAYDALVAWLSVPGATGYRIYAADGPECSSAVVDVGPIEAGPDGIVRAIVRGIPARTARSFTVTSYDDRENESAPSKVMVLTEDSVLGAFAPRAAASRAQND